MIVGIGIDLLDVGRMARELARDGAGFRDDVFSPGETAYCEGMAHPARHFAARFAAKEAFWKAVGSGPEAVSLRDVEVRRGEAGRPRLVLAGAARRAADRLGVTAAFVSLSHTAALASASVVLERETGTEERRDG
ncbi:MAG: holo-ACP synthase [Thermoanaerobaculia bacterium]|nr:holo-ACP synthase [Thermoanaerobaculia bacterium]